MDESRGHGHHSGDGDHHATVAADAHELSLDAGQQAARDAHAVAAPQFGRVGVEVDVLFVRIARYGDEVAHLFVRNDQRAAGRAVRDRAHRQPGVGCDRAQLLRRGVHEQEVVHGGDERAPAPLAADRLLVAHRHEAFDAAGVETSLDDHFAAVGHAQRIPVYGRIFGRHEFLFTVG